MFRMPVVPIIHQAKDYSCGAAALASCLRYWGVWDGEEKDLYKQLHTTHKGTDSKHIIAAAKHFGLKAGYKKDLTIKQLKWLCDKGYTVILSIQGGGRDKSDDWKKEWSDGHYVCLVDVLDDGVAIMDPYIGKNGKIRLKEFKDRWHDYSDSGNSKEYNPGIILRGNKPAGKYGSLIINAGKFAYYTSD